MFRTRRSFGRARIIIILVHPIDTFCQIKKVKNLKSKFCNKDSSRGGVNNRVADRMHVMTSQHMRQFRFGNIETLTVA